MHSKTPTDDPEDGWASDVCSSKKKDTSHYSLTSAGSLCLPESLITPTEWPQGLLSAFWTHAASQPRSPSQRCLAPSFLHTKSQSGLICGSKNTVSASAAPSAYEKRILGEKISSPDVSNTLKQLLHFLRTPLPAPSAVPSHWTETWTLLFTLWGAVDKSVCYWMQFLFIYFLLKRTFVFVVEVDELKKKWELRGIMFFSF